MIAVIIVTYNSEDIIRNCLDSLARSEGEALRVVICDNASTDATVQVVRDWSAERRVDFDEIYAPATGQPTADFTLLRSPRNLGFAGGVNRGLEFLLRDAQCDLFWLLNPDCEIETTTASAFRRRAHTSGAFSLMGSRILYCDAPGLIQSDGGRVGRWTGICRNLNQGGDPRFAIRPDARDIDFISGASVVASRDFIEAVGLMREDYFLYYEEVEWAARRGDLPLLLCNEALVHHQGGTAIGSGSITRRASPLALYFNYRNRMRYLAQVNPIALPVSCLASLARILKLAVHRAWPEAWAALLGMFQLPPPSWVRAVLSEDAAEYAFGRRLSSTTAPR
ncbi:glycosyltransferase family 2 protein [uncultured Roseovarius sp.]|uniref:glycosyltransferase family 2 protein n=1 Tax=uncultured Roseovarius sp. TaxID=293344 RepID=UPI0025E4AA8A|nr:glycosyltransferase family 2 protein [uncultured Roseovarius sp.]